MSPLPRIYIIILTWNGRDDTVDCIRSLSKVEYPNYRVILVDNASMDGTAEAVRQEFPDVEVIVNTTNLRFAGGNNVGLRKAIAEGADYILLLNNDTIVDKDFLAKMVDAALSENNVGMVGPKIYYNDDKRRIWYAGGKIEFWKGWISHRGVHEVDHGQYDHRCETDYITGCCILVDRRVIQEIGYLDESYFIYGEDADWCIRAHRAGYKLIFEPGSVIWHKLSVSSGGHLSWFKNYNKLKSQFSLMARYAKWYYWFTIPFSMIINGLLSYCKIVRYNRHNLQ